MKNKDSDVFGFLLHPQCLLESPSVVDPLAYSLQAISDSLFAIGLQQMLDSPFRLMCSFSRSIKDKVDFTQEFVLLNIVPRVFFFTPDFVPLPLLYLVAGHRLFWLSYDACMFLRCVRGFHRSDQLMNSLESPDVHSPYKRSAVRDNLFLPSQHRLLQSQHIKARRDAFY